MCGAMLISPRKRGEVTLRPRLKARGTVSKMMRVYEFRGGAEKPKPSPGGTGNEGVGEHVRTRFHLG